MKLLLVALGIWFVALVLAGAGLILRAGSSEIAGALVLESAPYCDFYVVKTPPAYVYLVVSPAEIAAMTGATEVRGPLLVLGRHSVHLDERTELSVTVVGTEKSWEAAKVRFASECRTPDLPAEFMKDAQ